MKTWLCATDGNSGYGTRTFPGPAVYDLTDDAEALRWARREAGVSHQLALVDSDEPPTITSPPVGEPLRSLAGWLPSLVVPRGGRVLATAIPDDRVVRHADPQPRLPDGEAPSRPLNYPCPAGRCDRRFPSSQVAALHAEVAHGADSVRPPADELIEPPLPEPALTDA